MSPAFAVIARNERATLPAAIEMASNAAEPGERVLYVDSGSTDGSPELAESLGVEVVRAEVGKGRAIAAALDAVGEGPVCLLDADVWPGSDNLGLALRRAYDSDPADMVVADFTWPEKQTFTVLPGVYFPLLESLFPEAITAFGPLAIVGFRIVDAGLPFGDLPPGYGVEAHMNIVAALEGFTTRLVPCGTYHGPARDNLIELSEQIAEAVLTLAGSRGRLANGRAPWEAWVAEVLDAVRASPTTGHDAFLERIAELKERRPAAA